MAILRSERYTMEVTLRWHDREGVVYDLVPKWNGMPIVNEEVLKRVEPFWSRGPRNGFPITEYGRSRPLPFLRKMLHGTEPDDYEPTEPDVCITVWPLHAMPQDRSNVVWESERQKRRREEQEAKKRELGELPDDLFRVDFFFDTYHFTEAILLTPEGLTFTFYVERAELERFVEDLERERAVIVARYATNPEGHGSADAGDY